MQWHEWLGMLGSIASLVGLVLTVIVLRNVKRLRARYVRQMVYTQCAGKLKAHRRNLAAAISKGHSASVRQHSARIRAVLERIKLHRGANERVEWLPEEVDRILNSGEERVVSCAAVAPPIIDERIERIGLIVTEIEWGNEDD